MKDKIASLLKDKLQALSVEVIDESDQHTGHQGAKSGGGHYRALVISSQFERLSLVQRHRLVQELVFKEFPGKIHALSIKAMTPHEVE